MTIETERRASEMTLAEALDALEAEVGVMESAMKEALTQRAMRDMADANMKRLELETMQTIEGKNADERKANLQAALDSNTAYIMEKTLTETAHRQMETANLYVTVSTARQRLYRAVIDSHLRPRE